MSVKQTFLLMACLVMIAPQASFAAAMLSIHQNKDEETITLAPGAVSPNKVFILENPDRLVIDVPAFSGTGLILPPSYKDGAITKIRNGHFNPTTSRVVFDLSKKITVQDKQIKNGKLIIEIASIEKSDSEERIDTPIHTTETSPPEPSKPGKDRVEEPKIENNPFRKASDKNREAKKTTESQQAIEEEQPEKEKNSKKSKPNKKVTTAKSGKPVIVIDAGHGGIDPGTSGTGGTVEKMMTLEYAQALRAKLQKSGHYQVVLTRDNDQFIMLRKRVEIARKAKGDLFISIHADSAPGAARGLSIYTVSEQASDAEAEKLAARENKADVLAGINLTGEREDVAGILISLAERDTKNRSATLADTLVTALDDKVYLLPESHRFAGFAVLKAPDIPSVLIEIGFLSNAQEEKQIKSKAYRDKVISGIAAGVDSYFKKERQLQE